MKIAIETDMKTPLPKAVCDYLEEKGHTVSTFLALGGGNYQAASSYRSS
ncbi:MAG: hypothetical protein R2788_22570 [Saprospiraceae bacterium]